MTGTVPSLDRASLIGYARVSTHDQHPEAQLDTLKAAGCARVFTDKASGKLAKRPNLDAALDYCRPGDVLTITRLDRLGRSVRNLMDLADLLSERGVGLKVLQQGIDTTTPAGKMFFHVLAALAEFEASLISERTKDGLAAARARGRRGGRRLALNPQQMALLLQEAAKPNASPTQLARQFNISRYTVYRYVERSKAS